MLTGPPDGTLAAALPQAPAPPDPVAAMRSLLVVEANVHAPFFPHFLRWQRLCKCCRFPPGSGGRAPPPPGQDAAEAHATAAGTWNIWTIPSAVWSRRCVAACGNDHCAGAAAMCGADSGADCTRGYLAQWSFVPGLSFEVLLSWPESVLLTRSRLRFVRRSKLVQEPASESPPHGVRRAGAAMTQEWASVRPKK